MTEITNKTDAEILSIVSKIVDNMIDCYSEAYCLNMYGKNGDSWEDKAREKVDEIREILYQIEEQNRPILKAQLEAILQVL